MAGLHCKNGIILGKKRNVIFISTTYSEDKTTTTSLSIERKSF